MHGLVSGKFILATFKVISGWVPICDRFVTEKADTMRGGRIGRALVSFCVREIVGSNPGRVKPMTYKLILVTC